MAKKTTAEFITHSEEAKKEVTTKLFLLMQEIGTQFPETSFSIGSADYNEA